MEGIVTELRAAKRAAAYSAIYRPSAREAADMSDLLENAAERIERLEDALREIGKAHTRYRACSLTETEKELPHLFDAIGAARSILVAK
jgi:hypothetical protein